MLNLDGLRHADTALSRVLEKSENIDFMTRLDEIARNAIKSGAIQHFEFTYELSWKFMKRWLEMNISPTVADDVTRRELFRLAAEQRLITDVEQWMRYHTARNLTSHTYEQITAEKVYQVIPGFAQDALKLLQQLDERND